MAPSPPPAERGQAGFHLLGAGVVAALVFVLWLAMSGVGFVTSYCRPRDLTDGNSRSLRLAGTVVIVILAAVALSGRRWRVAVTSTPPPGSPSRW